MSLEYSSGKAREYDEPEPGELPVMKSPLRQMDIHFAIPTSDGEEIDDSRESLSFEGETLLFA